MPKPCRELVVHLGRTMTMLRPRRTSWKALPLILLAGCAVADATEPACRMPAKPNVLLILVDDLGDGDLGCYGNTYHETLNIDRLASQGMRFIGGTIRTTIKRDRTVPYDPADGNCSNTSNTGGWSCTSWQKILANKTISPRLCRIRRGSCAENFINGEAPSGRRCPNGKAANLWRTGDPVSRRSYTIVLNVQTSTNRT